MSVHQLIAPIVVLATVLIVSGSRGDESDSQGPSRTKLEATSTAELRESFLRMMTVHAHEMSDDELRAAIQEAERQAKIRRELAAGRDLGVAVGQLEKVVREYKGTEAEKKAREALDSLGYSVWLEGKVYPAGTFIISGIPFVR